MNTETHGSAVKSGGTTETVLSRAQEQVTQVTRSLKRTDRSVRSFVAERPVTATLCAVGLGFLIGRLFSRV